jgi:hypothetical protein
MKIQKNAEHDLHSSYTGDNSIVFRSNINVMQLVRHIAGMTNESDSI